MELEGDWLLPSGQGGTAYKIEVVELVSTPALANGAVVWCGRLALPSNRRVPVSPEHRLKLKDGREMAVWILDVTKTEVTFCGRLA